MFNYFDTLNRSSVEKFFSDESFSSRISSLQPYDWFSVVVTEFKERVSVFSAIYDAVSDSVVNCTSIIKWMNEKAGKIRELMKDRSLKLERVDQFIRLDQEEADLIRSALKNAINKASGYDLVQISDAFGNVFEFYSSDGFQNIYCETIDGAMPFLTDGNTINMLVYPINYSESSQAVIDEGVTLKHSMEQIIMRNRVPNPSGSTLVGMSKDICRHFNIPWVSIFSFSTDYASRYDVAMLNVRENLTQISVAEGRLTSIVFDDEDSNIKANDSYVATQNKYTAFEVFTDLAHSSLINDTLVDISNAVGSADPVSLLKQAYDKLASSVSYGANLVRNMLDTAIQAASATGKPGLIEYICGYFRVQSTIVQSDGTIKYTNNLAYVPKQFIAGLITSSVSSLLEMASMVATIVKPIIGIIIAGIAAVTRMISNLVSTAVNQESYPCTRSEYVPDSNVCLNASPLAMLHGSILYHPNSLYYSRICSLFISDRSPKSLSVPGGYIIIGPGSVSSKGKISSLIWEFHPRAFYMKEEVKPTDIDESLRHMLQWTSNNVNGHDIIRPEFGASLSSWKNPEQISKFWNELIRKWDMRGPGYNVQNSITSQRLISGLCLSVSVFLMFAQSISPAVYYPDRSSMIPVPGFKTVGESVVYGVESVGAAGVCLFHEMTTIPDRDAYYSITIQMPDRWTNVAQYFVDMQDNDVPSDTTELLFYERVPGSLEPSGPDLPWLWPHSTHNVELCFQNAFLESGPKVFYDVCSHPNRIDYEYKVPLYDPASSKFWLVFSVVAVAATTISAVVVSTVVKKIRAKRNFARIAKNGDARQTAIDAFNGRREVIENNRPHTEVFDTKSPEGQAYIDQCWKEYKSNSLTSNISACVFGGTKFDVTSYYGDADVSEDEASSGFRSWSDYYTTAQSLAAQSSLAQSGMIIDGGDTNVSRIIDLIVGVPRDLY